MPRLSKTELDTLKQSISLIGLLESEGFKLKKQGKDYVMLCPFHQEKTPSFSVSPSKNWNGFTEHHLSALLHHGTKQVYIAYDRDQAGDSAAEKLALQLQQKGILPWRVVLPTGRSVCKGH